MVIPRPFTSEIGSHLKRTERDRGIIVNECGKQERVPFPAISSLPEAAVEVLLLFWLFGEDEHLAPLYFVVEINISKKTQGKNTSGVVFQHCPSLTRVQSLGRD